MSGTLLQAGDHCPREIEAGVPCACKLERWYFALGRYRLRCPVHGIVPPPHNRIVVERMAMAEEA